MAMPAPPEPRIGFVIGGVQKAGTSALAKYLSAHPALRLPARKEAHVFDAPDFDEAWTQGEIDARYAGLFDAGNAAALHGDATPFYLFQPQVVARIARYNPGMRWIVLLRDPADRALSHYHMERRRGHEHWPLVPALLCERWRLRAHLQNFRRGSPLRRHSYRARGDYARQLDALYAHFPQQQVLLLRSDALRHDTARTLARVHGFLGVPDAPASSAYLPVFTGDYAVPAPGSLTMRWLRWLMRHELQALRERYGLAFDPPYKR